MSIRMKHTRAPDKAARKAATARAQLQVWLSPAFPVGAFAYSHGLEKAVENGWIGGRGDLEAWIGDLIDAGSLRNDLIMLAAAWSETQNAMGTRLRDIAELALALQPTAERCLEARQQGGSFIAMVESAWPSNAPRWAELGGDICPIYSVAVGFASASHAIPLVGTLSAYAVAFASNLMSAAIRLSVIGQTDAQLIMASLLERLLAAARSAEQSCIDDLGGAVWRSDIASMQHETQYTRLFRS